MHASHVQAAGGLPADGRVAHRLGVGNAVPALDIGRVVVVVGRVPHLAREPQEAATAIEVEILGGRTGGVVETALERIEVAVDLVDRRRWIRPWGGFRSVTER